MGPETFRPTTETTNAAPSVADAIRIALCLSGGGYRAALFHLGALRRLNELGILGRIETITSVSGGSILSAHLARTVTPWPAPGQVFADWDTRVAATFHNLVQRDIRTGPILRAALLPWNWLQPSAGATLLQQQYERYLTPARLCDLPRRPDFIFCATDMAFAVNWEFSRDRVGDYQAGRPATPADWPVAKAVAASSCFPPIFKPLRVGLRPEQYPVGHFPAGPRRNKLLAKLSLTDGGVYDNLGLEPVWKSHGVLLVSDGGGPTSFDDSPNLLGNLMRYSAILQSQVGALRKRWLVDRYKAAEKRGTYWGVGSAVERYGVTDLPAYSKDLARDTIANIRTDLDAFAPEECRVLENHGYLLAEAAIRTHAPTLYAPTAPPPAPPAPELMDPAKVRIALADSHKRISLGRVLRQLFGGG